MCYFLVLLYVLDEGLEKDKDYESVSSMFVRRLIALWSNLECWRNKRSVYALFLFAVEVYRQKNLTELF